MLPGRFKQRGRALAIWAAEAVGAAHGAAPVGQRERADRAGAWIALTGCRVAILTVAAQVWAERAGRFAPPAVPVADLARATAGDGAVRAKRPTTQLATNVAADRAVGAGAPVVARELLTGRWGKRLVAERAGVDAVGIACARLEEHGAFEADGLTIHRCVAGAGRAWAAITIAASGLAEERIGARRAVVERLGHTYIIHTGPEDTGIIVQV